MKSFLVELSITYVIPKYKTRAKVNNGIISGKKSKILSGYVKNCSETTVTKIDVMIVAPMYLIIGG